MKKNDGSINSKCLNNKSQSFKNKEISTLKVVKHQEYQDLMPLLDTTTDTNKKRKRRNMR